jgi:outer membrane protein assembly factor BamB
MNSNQLECAEGGLLPKRQFKIGNSIVEQETFRNEFFHGGKIFCCLGPERNLVVVDEKTLTIEKECSVLGYSVAWVGDDFILFKNEDQLAYLLDRKTYEVVKENLPVPKTMIAVSSMSSTQILFEYRRVKKYFGLFDWLSMSQVWESNTEGRLSNGQVVSGGYLYYFHLRGIVKIDISNGNMLWEKLCQAWLSHPFFVERKIDTIEIRSESAAIYADTLVLALSPTGIAGVDVHTGDLRWVLEAKGTLKMKVTQEGIAYITSTNEIQRIDVATGTLLAPIPIQYQPVLDKDPSARLGGADLSDTHIIAEVSGRTKNGRQGHIVGIHRETGVCEWAYPIQGTVTKLFLLNNRIYATGTMLSADYPEPISQTLIIEGEGGYIPD